MQHLEYACTRDLSSCDRVQALKFIKAEQRKGRKSIGWIPWSGVERAHGLGRVGILKNNDDIVAFIIYGPSRTSAKVFQIWVRKDARLMIHGRAIITNLADWALRRQLLSIRLWCATDLESNFFWQALGFENVGQRIGGNKGRRRHNHWVASCLQLVATQRHPSIERPGLCVAKSQSPTHPGAEAADRTERRRQLTLCDPW